MSLRSYEINKLSLLYQLELSRNADMTKMKHLIFECQQPMNIDEFKNIVSEYVFKIEINASTMLKHKLSLYIELNDIITCGNKYSITIPSYIIMNDILVGALRHNQIKIDLLKSYNNPFNNIHITFEDCFCDQLERSFIQQERHINPFQEIQYQDYNVNNNNATLLLNTFYASLTKGYFIEGDITKITNLELHFNGQRRISYDDMMIQLYCHKISDNLLYLPMDTNNDSYLGAFYQTVYNTIQMKLMFSENTRHVRIYSVSLKLLVYNNGQCMIYTPDQEYINSMSPELLQDVSDQFKIINNNTTVVNNIILPMVTNLESRTTTNNRTTISNNRTTTRVQPVPPVPLTTLINLDDITTNVLVDLSSSSSSVLSSASTVSNSSRNNSTQNVVTNIIADIPGWRTIIKEFDGTRGNECPISFDIIGTCYCCCRHCNNNFDFDAIKRWLTTNNTCPLCRGHWGEKIRYTQPIVLL